MKSSKGKKRGLGSSPGVAQQFLVWHGEKIVVGFVAVAAIWFALQGLGYPTLSWQPDELERWATDAEADIKRNVRSAAEEMESANTKISDYTVRAEQIKTPVPSEPYRLMQRWDPLPGFNYPNY